jgi:hypothetical protein
MEKMKPQRKKRAMETAALLGSCGKTNCMFSHSFPQRLENSEKSTPSFPQFPQPLREA